MTVEECLDRYEGIGRELERLEERYRLVEEHSRDVIFTEDMNFRITYVSPSVTSMFGYTVEEICRLQGKSYMTPESMARAMRDFQKYSALARKNKDLDLPLMEYEYVRKDGSTFWGELKVNFIYDSGGNPIGIQGILRNIDERKKIEAALRESQSKFQTIFELSPQPIALSEMHTGLLKEVNRKFCELSGFSREEVINRIATELGFYSEAERKRFIETLRESGKIEGIEMAFRTKSGAILNTLAFSRVVRLQNTDMILSIVVDVTEQRRLEAMLRHAQKMEAVGTLAGGIAHDFNNLLQGVSGFTQVLLMEKPPPDPDYEKLAAIENIVKRGSELTKRLLVYPRRVKSELKPLQINQEVIEVCKLLEHLGYAVITAMSGEEAVEIFQEQAQDIDLVILDLGMPGMGGKICMKELNKIRPETQVIIASGYSQIDQEEDITKMGIAGFVGKPYQIEDLDRMIRKVLGQTQRVVGSGASC